MSSITAVPIAPVKRSYLVYLFLGVVLAVIAAAALAMQGDTGVTVTPSGLRYKVLTPGKGTEHPTNSDITLITYEGRLLDGTTFDQSQRPVPMPVSGVVPGFSEGLKLMTKGSKYRFWLPPQLAYGDKAAGPIPPNSTLVFDVELVDFLPESVVQQMQQQQQMQQAMPGQQPPAGIETGPR